jgi:hypothetical protein
VDYRLNLAGTRQTPAMLPLAVKDEWWKDLSGVL